jgi:hypothetical protein
MCSSHYISLTLAAIACRPAVGTTRFAGAIAAGTLTGYKMLHPSSCFLPQKVNSLMKCFIRLLAQTHIRECPIRDTAKLATPSGSEAPR